MAAPPAPPAPPSGGDTGRDEDGRKRWLILLLLLLVLLLLICGGFSYFNWWRKTTPEAVKPSPSATVTRTVSPTASPSVPVSPTPSSARIVNMPDVVGMPAADAKMILEGAGLGSVTFVDDKGQDLPVLASRRVTKQSVAPGTQIPVDTAIVITTRVTSNGKG
jgi:hypothetical protein